MVSKIELHKKYVELIQQGKKEEAQKVLKQIWNFVKEVQVEEKPIVKDAVKPIEKTIVKEVSKKKETTLDSLENVKGIGKETIADIKRIFGSYKELEEYVKSGKELPFLNHIDKKIISFVNKKWHFTQTQGTMQAMQWIWLM